MTTRFKGFIATASVAVIIFAVAGGLGVHASNSDNGAYKQLGVYSEVLQRIRSEYVEEPNSPPSAMARCTACLNRLTRIPAISALKSTRPTGITKATITPTSLPRCPSATVLPRSSR